MCASYDKDFCCRLISGAADDDLWTWNTAPGSQDFFKDGEDHIAGDARCHQEEEVKHLSRSLRI